MVPIVRLLALAYYYVPSLPTNMHLYYRGFTFLYYINHRCVSKVGMLSQQSGKHNWLRYSTYMWLQMYKLCIDSAKSEAIRKDKLIMFMTSTLIYFSC